MIFKKWKGDEDVKEMHRHDYRWITDKKEREAWIRKYWVIEEEEDESNI